MTRIGITGGMGFIGWHLRCLLATCDHVESDVATRETFGSSEALQDFVDGSDVVVHLAGVNRAPDREIREGNLRLARAVIDACERREATPHLVFASSTHVERDPRSVYGAAKAACAELFGEWAIRTGASFIELVIPHVFGEHGRPYYNSAVATFCHQITHGEEPEILNDTSLELIHVQLLCEKILEAARAPVTDRWRLRGVPVTVSEVLERLREMLGLYKDGILPDLSDDFSRDLFNTLRSYGYPDRYPITVPCHRDNRGVLFETVKGLSGGQCFLSTTIPEITRGDHFHRRKFERFFVVSGRAVIRVRRLFEDAVAEFELAGDQPSFVDIPTLHTHNITNVGDEELLTLFWAHEIFDPDRPDTYAQPV